MNTLHHAYIVFGKDDDGSIGQKIGFWIIDKYKDGVEEVTLVYEQISVDNVSEIIRAMSIVPRSGSARLVSARALGIGTSAQHALLKILEEPILNSYISISLPHEIPLMPTILSRVQIVRGSSTAEGVLTNDLVHKFLKNNVVQRLEQTKSILADYDKEKVIRSDIVQFLAKVISMYKSEYKGKIDSPQLKSVLLVETYLRDTNTSLKQCLELLALSM